MNESTPPIPPAQAWLETADGKSHALGIRSVLGRHPHCDIRLVNPSVSRTHAEVNQDATGAYRLTDLDSANGTFVNGKRVATEALQHGMTIHLGSEKLLFHQPSRAPANRGATQSADRTVVFVRRQTVEQWFALADVIGFGNLHRSQPAEQVELWLRAWIGEMEALVEKHHGHLNKRLGDGLLFVFDAERSPAEFASLFAAMRQQQARSPLHFRFLLHFGSASYDGVDYLGPQVNLLFRAEKIASQKGWPLVCTGPAQARLPGLSWQNEGEFAFADVEQPVALWTLPTNP